MTGLRWGATTDPGNVRTNNEDHLLVAEPLFAVADGMGGHAYGEVASETAIDGLRVAFTNTPSGLVEAVKRANRAVWEKAHSDPAYRGMGTTLCAVALVEEDGDERLAIVNVGDSRVYLLRDGELEQLTTDHRLLEQLLMEGQISPDEAAVHPQRHVLTRAVGLDPDVDVDCWQLDPFKGDRILLCSDGLSGELEAPQIASVLRRLADPTDAVKELVRQAKSAGGHDNITVIVVDVVDDDDRVGRANETLATEGPGPVGDAAPRTAVIGRVDGSDGDGSGGNGAGAKAPTKPPKVKAPRTSPINARVILFIAAVVVVIAAALGTVTWYAHDGYTVQRKGDRVVLYKGHTGVPGFSNGVAKSYPVAWSQIASQYKDAVSGGKWFGSRGEADRYAAAIPQPQPAP